jgi:hypothetical protein
VIVVSDILNFEQICIRETKLSIRSYFTSLVRYDQHHFEQISDILTNKYKRKGVKEWREMRKEHF